MAGYFSYVKSKFIDLLAGVYGKTKYGKCYYDS